MNRIKFKTINGKTPNGKNLKVIVPTSDVSFSEFKSVVKKMAEKRKD